MGFGTTKYMEGHKDGRYGTEWRQRFQHVTEVIHSILTLQCHSDLRPDDPSQSSVHSWQIVKVYCREKGFEGRERKALLKDERTTESFLVKCVCLCVW